MRGCPFFRNCFMWLKGQGGQHDGWVYKTYAKWKQIKKLHPRLPIQGWSFWPVPLAEHMFSPDAFLGLTKNNNNKNLAKNLS